MRRVNALNQILALLSVLALLAGTLGCGQPAPAPTAAPAAAAPTSAPAAAATSAPAAAATAAPAAAATAAPAAKKPSGKVVIGVSSIGTGLIDPHKIQTGIELMWAKAFAEGLVSRDFEGKLIPKLAEKWEVSPDAKSVTFTLRKGVKFHDGSEMTADDVKWSFDRVVSDDIQSARKAQIQAFYAGTDVVDPYHVVLRLKAPDALLWDLLDTYMVILPKKLYDGKPAAAVNDNPVGTGPWKFVSRQGNDVINVTAFEGQWSHVAYVKDLTFRVIPQAATLWAALKSGEVDIADLTGAPFIAEAKNDPTLKIKRNLGGAVLDLVPNVEYFRSKDTVTDADKPFLDVRVRRAMSLALDRKAMVDNFFHGFASPAKSRFVPYSRGYSKDDPDPQYDPAKAKQLLAEAGYANGFKTELHYIDAAGTPGTLVEFMQSNWRAVGVDVVLKKEEAATFVSSLLGGKYHGLGMRQQAGLNLYEAAAAWSTHYKGAVFPPYDKLSDLGQQYVTSLEEAKLNSTADAIRKTLVDETTELPPVYMDWVFVLGPKVEDWTLVPGSMIIIMSTDYIKLKGQ